MLNECSMGWVVVAHAFNPSTREGGRGRWISEFEASLIYRASARRGSKATEKGCLEKIKKRRSMKLNCTGLYLHILTRERNLLVSRIIMGKF